MGIFLFLIFLVISFSGILLGWKKNSGGYLLPDTQNGTTSGLNQWLTIDTLTTIGISAILEEQQEQLTLDRLDIRPDKGIIKIVFVEDQWEVQLDGATGTVLSIGRRRSDWIEDLHDGSLMDNAFGTAFIKLLFTSISGISLALFSITGFWLWYGPKLMRNQRID
ncbi:MAG: putative iron-regulated membrane protein [Cyclobacteriaceae bacterium]|jgi:uncharacterized iron-regulated membrane protein